MAVRAEVLDTQRAHARGSDRRLRMVDSVPLPPTPPKVALQAQRVVDVSVAFVALAVFAIPMVLIAIAIRSTSRGSALFRHDRVGRNGEVFQLVKFRTMRTGTYDAVLGDEAQRAAYRANGYKLAEDDPRITPLGRLLRRTSLDELPQLLNVVNGDMSLVGVRPLVPDELAERPARDQQLYCRFRPGMTGLWQVEGRSTLVGVERLDADRRHLEAWSLANDIRILVRTPSAVMRVSEAR